MLLWVGPGSSSGGDGNARSAESRLANHCYRARWERQVNLVESIDRGDVFSHRRPESLGIAHRLLRPDAVAYERHYSEQYRWRIRSLRRSVVQHCCSRMRPREGLCAAPTRRPDGCGQQRGQAEWRPKATHRMCSLSRSRLGHGCTNLPRLLLVLYTPAPGSPYSMMFSAAWTKQRSRRCLSASLAVTACCAGAIPRRFYLLTAVSVSRSKEAGHDT